MKVLDDKHRRSPLVQGGLEIPILVTIKMDHSVENNRAKIAKFEEMLKKDYKEPVNDKFEDATNAILESIRDYDDCSASELDETDEDEAEVFKKASKHNYDFN